MPGISKSLAAFETDERHVFVRGNIGDRNLVGQLLEKYQPRAVINFAAEFAC